MLRLPVIFIEIILSYLLQASVFTHFELAGVVPDMLLILVCSVAYTEGRNAGILTGFFSGLVIDCTYGSFIGLFALIYMSIGYLCGFGNKIYKSESYTFPYILIGCSEFIYNLAYYFCFMVMKGNLNFGYYFVAYIVPRIIYTVFISILVYRLYNLQHCFFEDLPYRKLKRKKKKNGNTEILS